MEYVFNNENFETEVLNSDIPVLVDFYADWCGPCKMMAPIVHQLAEAYAGRMKIGKLNVDNALSVAQKYRVMNIPTFIFFKGGEPVMTAVGGMSRADLEAKIQQVLS
ncbi:MAG: thioredoxin [Lachnospiraceae bacterium]|nr:thioredoxin [Lachnospiraceae bacterium]